MRTAAIVTVGSELTAGLRLDTNTAEIARALDARGYEVIEAVSVSDDVQALGAVLARLCATYELVITTGGLGPTHDDVTREAAAHALGRKLVRDPRLVELLKPMAARHSDPAATAQIMVQADVFGDAHILDFTTGTAPGMIVPTPAGRLALLPGPPSEMRPMLKAVIGEMPLVAAEPREIGVVGMSESDVQVVAQRAIAGLADVGFTVLARPGDVRVLLLDRGCGAKQLDNAAAAVAQALGDNVYSLCGESLAQTVIALAASHSMTVGVAESCTGGMVASALTDVAGSSAVVYGGVVAYNNSVKVALLGVDEQVLERFGAVSEECARAMAQGARTLLGVDIAVSVTGVAGPGGGSADKPVGMVWFGIASAENVSATQRLFSASSRDSIRTRATAVALDLLRRAVRSV